MELMEVHVFVHGGTSEFSICVCGNKMNDLCFSAPSGLVMMSHLAPEAHSDATASWMPQGLWLLDCSLGGETPRATVRMMSCQDRRGVLCVTWGRDGRRRGERKGGEMRGGGGIKQEDRGGVIYGNTSVCR